MLCSATLLISNKYAVYKVAAPSFILFSQLMGTALVVRACASMGKIECDRLEKDKCIKFLPVALIFLATIFSNMKSLQYANVETFMGEFVITVAHETFHIFLSISHLSYS